MVKARQRFSMRSRLGLVLYYQGLVNQVLLVPSLEKENDRKDKPVVNPSLTQTPRYQIADVILLEYETSILHWLERIGRLIDRTSDNDENLLSSEEEIAELIENDGKYDDDDDDDILVDDD
jgi:hypothetical protein